MARSIRLAAVIAGLLFGPALTGCVDGDDGAVVEPTGAPPGTPIADDLVVPPGSVMWGEPFLNRDRRAADTGEAVSTRAILQVTGDPIQAIDDVIRQAADMGIGMTVYSEDMTGADACQVVVADDDSTAGERYAISDSDLPDEPLAMVCDIVGVSTPSAAPHLSLTVRAIVSERPEPYLAFIDLTLTQSSAPLPGTPDVLGARVPTGPMDGDSPVEVPEPTSSTRQPGDPLGVPFAPEGEDYKLLPSSALVGPPLPSTCATGGFVAVIRADDDLDVAIDRYGSEMAEGAFRGVTDPEVTQEFTAGGSGDTEYRYRSYWGAGAGQVDVWAVARADGGAYVLIDRCND